jgi:hypothetical protein
MYPRNAASPPIIDLGQILQLSDGAVQTSGASVRVKIGTGSWGAGAGSLDCDATSGIWTYAPTQAETNDAFFVVGVYKTGCSALSKTVITSASDTAGYAGLDWSKLRAPTTTVGLSGTTIKTATDIETDTVDIQSRIPTALDNGLMRSSVEAMGANTLTASALAADAVSEIQSGLALQSTLNTLGSTVVAIGLAVDSKPSLTQIEGTTVLAKQNTLTTGITDILTAVDGINVGDVDIDNETIAQLVFQSIVGSGLAKYSIPQVTGTIEAVKYADFELSISASTASDSVLYLSIGCENHTTPNLQADSTDGLTILNQLEDFDPADVTVQRTSPTVVDVWISARVLSRLSAADYLIALTEITSDAKTKLRFEKHFSLRSGAGRIIG